MSGSGYCEEFVLWNVILWSIVGIYQFLYGIWCSFSYIMNIEAASFREAFYDNARRQFSYYQNLMLYLSTPLKLVLEFIFTCLPSTVQQ
jgi:hypothetical protein